MTETPAGSRDAAYFNRLYEANPDPWNFTGSDYERQKYDATIAALKGRRFAAGFEVGCSIGVLTARLARQCAQLLAIDIAPAALAQAEQRCAALRNIRFECRRVPEEWPEGRFDLIVLSEVLYFFTPADIARVAAKSCAAIAPGGIVLLVNYTGETPEPCTGAAAAAHFIAGASCLSPVARHDGERFRIDVLQAAHEAAVPEIVDPGARA